MDPKERLRILSTILTVMVSIAGWLAIYDPNVRSKFMELTVLYTGSMFALMNPANSKD